MSRTNWHKVLTDYISDETVSYQKIADKYGVSKRAVVKQAKKANWQLMRQQTALKVHQKLPEKVGEELAETVVRHVKYAQLLQGIAVKTLVDQKDETGRVIKPGLKPTTFEQARLGLFTGVTIERKALNIDEKDNQPTTIQVVFSSPEVEAWAK